MTHHLDVSKGLIRKDEKAFITFSCLEIVVDVRLLYKILVKYV